MKISERIIAVVLAFGYLAGAVTVITLAGSVWWPLEVLSHFRVQYFLLLLVAAGIGIIRKQAPPAIICTILALLNLAFFLPYFFPFDEKGGTGLSLKAVFINVHTANKEHEAVRSYLRDTDPDFFVLSEVDPVWLEAMAPFEKTHPFVRSRPRHDNFGIAMYSRLQPRRFEIIQLVNGGVPSILCELEAHGKVLSVLGTHPLPPRNLDYSTRRNLQYDAIASFLADIPGPKMIIGDMNATPWSFKFRELLARTSLRDSALGRGIQTTWPTNVLAFRIPIDHILVSSDVQVIERTVGSHVGSDHFPVKVVFSLGK